VENPEPSMLAEDFSYYALKIPGAIFNLGCRHPHDENFYNLHSSKFNLDESCIITGIQILSQCVLDFLDNIFFFYFFSNSFFTMNF